MQICRDWYGYFALQLISPMYFSPLLKQAIKQKKVLNRHIKESILIFLWNVLIDKAFKLDTVEIKPAGLLLSLQFYNAWRENRQREEWGQTEKTTGTSYNIMQPIMNKINELKCHSLPLLLIPKNMWNFFFSVFSLNHSMKKVWRPVEPKLSLSIINTRQLVCHK